MRVWPQAPRTLWVLLLAAGIWGGVALVVLIASNARATWDHRRDPGVALRPWHLVFFAGVCVVLIGPAVMMYGPYFDRYLLPLIPYAIVVATGVARPGEDPWGEASIRARAIATVGLALMGVWSMGAVHDYLERNRARWVAARYATGNLGVEPTRLDGGFGYGNDSRQTGPFVLYSGLPWCCTPIVVGRGRRSIAQFVSNRCHTRLTVLAPIVRHPPHTAGGGG